MRDLLLTAVVSEREGHREYMELARCTGNILGRQLFQALAAEELDHVRRIEDIHARLGGPGGGPSPVSGRSPEERMRESFPCPGGDGRDIVHGLELAMDRERRLLAIYGEILGRVGDGAARAFIAAIVDEERQHLEALKNVHFYLASTGRWFDEEEIRRWNWMNT